MSRPPISVGYWPCYQCAECEHAIGRFAAIDMLDGSRVHFEPIDCLISFGRRWRSDVDAALTALGLEPPDVAPVREDRIWAE